MSDSYLAQLLAAQGPEQRPSRLDLLRDMLMPSYLRDTPSSPQADIALADPNARPGKIGPPSGPPTTLQAIGGLGADAAGWLLPGMKSAALLKAMAAPLKGTVIPPASENIVTAINRLRAYLPYTHNTDVLQKNIDIMERGGPMAEAIAQHMLKTFQPHPLESANIVPAGKIIEGEVTGIPQRIAALEQAHGYELPELQAAQRMPENVISHAVQVGGKIYTGDTHLGAYNQALKDFGGIDPGGSKRNLFITNTGRIINQKEAIEISRKSLGIELPAIREYEPLERQVIDRGRSGRPITTEPLPIGTENSILEEGLSGLKERKRDAAYAQSPESYAIEAFQNDDMRKRILARGAPIPDWLKNTPSGSDLSGEARLHYEQILRMQADIQARKATFSSPAPQSAPDKSLAEVLMQ